MMIMQVIFVFSQVDKSLIKTNLAEVDKENTEICDITQAKPL